MDCEMVPSMRLTNLSYYLSGLLVGGTDRLGHLVLHFIGRLVVVLPLFLRMCLSYFQSALPMPKCWRR
jgi:hypothetical protein